MTVPQFVLGFVAVVLASSIPLPAVADPVKPVPRVYRTTPQGDLRLHLFAPPDGKRASSRAAIIVLHGGGWHVGDASWTFGTAQRYAELGLLAASVEYRLSNEKDVTPVEALDDVREAVRWLRRHAGELDLDPARIAAHGSSAGAHLATVAALGPDEADGIGGAPNALILGSLPADVSRSSWFRRLVGARDASAYSPLQLVKPGAPPMLVTMGAKDTVTPLAPVVAFCDAVVDAGGRCELKSYPGLGHLLTRNLDPRAQEEGPFDADPEAVADTRARVDAFLADLGYIAAEASGGGE